MVFNSLDSDLENIMARLKNLGLTLYEAKAYVTLVKKGVMTSTEIAKEAKIPQPRVYDVLRGLEEKGLVLVSEGRPKLYRAEEPRIALRRLIERIEKRIKEDYEATVLYLESIYMGEAREFYEEIWRIEGAGKIKDKLYEVINNAEYELLISAYKHVLNDLRNNLKRLSRRGVSICLVMYDDIEPLTFIDEHRYRNTRGIVIAIPDRKELVFVTNWYDPERLVPTGFYTQNKHLLKVFTEYFLHNLRDLSKPVYIAFGETVFIRKFVNMTRAINMINILKKQGRKVHLRVNGRFVKSKENAVVEGIPIDTIYDLYRGIARIILKTKDNRILSIGGWGATLEDVEANVIEVIS